MILHIIHRPVYISEHNVSETGFCLRLQVNSTQLGPIHRASRQADKRRSLGRYSSFADLATEFSFRTGVTLSPLGTSATIWPTVR
jgi:hypothetical protein